MVGSRSVLNVCPLLFSQAVIRQDEALSSSPASLLVLCVPPISSRICSSLCVVRSAVNSVVWFATHRPRFATVLVADCMAFFVVHVRRSMQASAGLVRPYSFTSFFRRILPFLSPPPPSLTSILHVTQC